MRPVYLAGWLLGVLCLTTVLHAGASDWQLTYGQALPDYQSTCQTLTNQGFRPICFDVDGTGTAASYSVVWVKDGFTDWLAETDLSVEQFRSRITAQSAAGCRVLCLDSYGNYPQERYAAVWVKDAKAADYVVDLRDSNWSKFDTRWDDGYCATWFDVNPSSGLWFSAVYCRRWSCRYAWYGSSEAGIRQKIQEAAPLMWPVVVHGYGTSFAAIGLDNDWSRCEEARVELNQTAVELSEAIEPLREAGYEPVSLTQCGGKYNSVWKRPLRSRPNLIAGLARLPQGTTRLSIPNQPITDLARFFELVPVQASTNLVDWGPLTTLIKTNSDAAPLFVNDDEAANLGMRFYRVPTNRFITPLLKPTGPFGVGEFSQLLTDPTRFDAARGTNWQFMVTCWYPTSARGGLLPAPYVGGILASNLGYTPLLSHSRVASLTAHASLGAPWAANLAACPVVLYVPCAESHRRENQMFVEELASHGFVVVGLDHQDTPAAVYPDGTVVMGQLLTNPSPAVIEAKRCEHIADAQLVLDQIAQWQSGNSILAGHLNLDHIGALGFSFGGSTAANLANTDARCQAAANLDGFLYGDDLVSSGCAKPFLMIRADTPDPEFTGDNRLKVFQLSKAAAYYLKFTGTIDPSFDERGFLLDLAVFNQFYGTSATTDGYRAQDLTRSTLVSFFKRHLKGEEDGVLDRFLTNSCPDVSMALQLNRAPGHH